MPANGRLPEDGRKYGSRSGRRDDVIAYTLPLHFGTRETRVVSPDFQTERFIGKDHKTSVRHEPEYFSRNLGIARIERFELCLAVWRFCRSSSRKTFSPLCGFRPTKRLVSSGSLRQCIGTARAKYRRKRPLASLGLIDPTSFELSRSMK